MSRFTSFQPPKMIKWIIFTTICITLLSSLSPFQGMIQWLALSSWGIHHLFLWQFITYLLIYPTQHGFSFGVLLNLLFNTYLLWSFGSWISHKTGEKNFLFLFFGGGLVAALAALSTSPYVFAGPTAAIYTLLIAWMMFHPDMELLLFLTIQAKAKWLILGFLGFSLLHNLAEHRYDLFFAYLAAMVYGYLYGLCVFEMPGPFKIFHPIEKIFIKAAHNVKHFFTHTDFTESHSGKIYDFKTGKAILKDEEFMDACLAKISKFGKKSLTWREKRKMHKISKQLKKKGN